MKVTAALCWFDEDPTLLRQCIKSLQGFVDELVAVDGPYDLWGAKKTHSSYVELATIGHACSEIGLSWSIVAGQRWLRQVDKRSAAIQAAANTGAEWVMPLDADWTFDGNPEMFKSRLEVEKRDVGLVKFITPPAKNAELFDEWHRAVANTTMQLPLIYRAFPDIRVEGCHWGYVAGQGVYAINLWDGPYTNATRFDVADLEITHRCFDREPRKIMENTAYIRRRTLETVGTEEP